MRRAVLLLLAACVIAGCATTPSGRSQLLLIPDSQINQMGATAFQQLRNERPLSANSRDRAYVECVGRALVAVLEPDWQRLPWEFELFEDASPNAFALPGGKVGVHTGLLTVARDQHQLATVIGHELAHVTFRHGAERVSQQMGASLALAALSAAAGGEQASEQRQLALGLLGVGAQVGVLLPFSRRHELEADLEGLRLMSLAGFDPSAAAALWRNMEATSGAGRPPTFLSTHPAPADRIRALEAEAERLRPLREQAIAAGRRPNCR